MWRKNLMIKKKIKEEIQKSQWQIKIKAIYKTKLSYCLKCRRNTESKNPKVIRTKNGRTMLLSKCSVCNRKKNRNFLKNKKIEDY